MKSQWTYGKSNQFQVKGWPAVAITVVYSAGWLLVTTAILKTAWAIVFGGLLG